MFMARESRAQQASRRACHINTEQGNKMSYPPLTRYHE